MASHTIDKEIIEKFGLVKAEINLNAQVAPGAGIFRFPNLSNVYIMESDLYGNAMPEGSCFIAFEARAGLIGKHMHIDTLRNYGEEDIRRIVEDNHNG